MRREREGGSRANKPLRLPPAGKPRQKKNGRMAMEEEEEEGVGGWGVIWGKVAPLI